MRTTWAARDGTWVPNAEVLEAEAKDGGFVLQAGAKDVGTVREAGARDGGSVCEAEATDGGTVHEAGSTTTKYMPRAFVPPSRGIRSGPDVALAEATSWPPT